MSLLEVGATRGDQRNGGGKGRGKGATDSLASECDGRGDATLLHFVVAYVGHNPLRLTQAASLGGALHLPSWTVVVGSKRLLAIQDTRAAMLQ